MTLDVDSFTGRWDYRELPPNVRLGNDVWIEDRGPFHRFYTQEDPGLVVGDRVRIYTWTRFSLEPTGRVVIGDDCILVGAMFWGAGLITVGNGVVISHGVTIADADFHPHDPDLRILDAVAHSAFGNRDERQPFEPEDVTIGDGAFVGIGAIILKGVTIGPGARIGAGAVVTKDVPPGATVAGNPARIVEGVRAEAAGEGPP